MAKTRVQSAPESSPALGHLTVRPPGEPAEVRFLFQQQEKRMGGALSASVLSHVAVLMVAIVITSLVPDMAPTALLPERLPSEIIWLADPGPGGGGGGGGNEKPDPPKKAELLGSDALTVPAMPSPAPVVVETKPEVPEPEPESEPEMELNIPAVTTAADTTASPAGVIDPNATGESDSRGSGTGAGAGTGSGTGIGSGQGSGLGEGFGGGSGGGAYRPGNGVEVPRLITQVQPRYTADAMRAKLQGLVKMECVVLSTGAVGSCVVKRSLDDSLGLDEEALKAARQWRFAPGTRFGEPVAVLVSIEMSFSLR